jgi:D-inositol-3-phosphate glycosyltransferase
MNVYVRELCSALARSGTECDIFTRSWAPDLEPVVPVEPGLRVHHVQAGPLAPVRKEDLPHYIEAFADSVLERIEAGPWGRRQEAVSAIHANYWLSGAAGHILKHRLDLPLVCTFHTLARVKAAAGESEEPGRAAEEATIIGCADAVFASNPLEAEQLTGHYGAHPDRVEIVPLGVDHAFFSPGRQSQARRAVGLPSGPMLLFLGRIQALKGADVAVAALEIVRQELPGAFLAVVGGPSGSEGDAEVARLHALVDSRGLGASVRFFPPQPHELVSTFCRAADVCVVPSSSESFGLVALEAAACGTPVVATSVGGLRTVVRDGATGRLVGERTPEAFAKATLEVLADPARARLMGAAAHRWARGFTWSAAAEGFRSACERLSAGALVECG